jgi:XrtJ-associated TM-motif-TM protein
MNRTMKSFALLSFVLLSATVAQAQSGCTNSPENPTALLGLLGAGGLFAARSRDKVRGFVQKALARHK